MIDIKILTIRDLLQITGVAFAQITPLSVYISGYKLDQASKILINDREVPEFVVESSNRVLAQVPDSERASTLRSVAAVAEGASIDRRSLLHFEVPGSIRQLSGLEKLVQIFCRILLQTPGSDRFRPSEGGGLLRLVGQPISRRDSRSLQAAVVNAVGRTRDQVMARQATKIRMSSDERLLSADVEAVGFDATTTTLMCRVNLAAISGRQAVANMTL